MMMMMMITRSDSYDNNNINTDDCNSDVGCNDDDR